MVTSEQVDKIFQALVKAQSEMGKAKKVNDNPFFKSKYADLSELIDVSKDVLTSNGLAVIQSPGASGQAVTVTTRIIHSSGQWIEDAITLQAIKTDPQAIGSAITYARRYQLAALLNIAQEDDDGNSASDRHGTNPEPKKENSELVELKQALIDYLNAGVFEHPENVEAVMAKDDMAGMKKALQVAKSREAGK